LPPWNNDFYRFSHGERITEITRRACLSMDRATLVAEAQKRGILCVPVQDVSDIAADEHLREREFFQRVTVHQLDDELELVRPPFVSSNYQAVAMPPPALGEHTAQVFREWCGIEVDDAVAVRP